MNSEYNFNKYIRGVCVVENGDILHGPPRKVKVCVQDPDGSAPPWWCCCWPRKPRLYKVAKFNFKNQKSEASLRKYTSLETAMYMNGMVFQQYWAPGKAVVKVSVKQRRGKKVVLFGRLTTFLDEMRDRKTDEFVLYVKETGFRIITKDRTASRDQKTDAYQKEIKEAPEEKGECDKHGYDETKEEINYMTSLLNSFKKKGEEPAKILTPEVMKLPTVIPVQAVQTMNLASCNYSFYKESLAARGRQNTASRAIPREIQSARNSKESGSEAQMVQIQRKSTAKEETAARGKYKEYETEKGNGDTEAVKNAAPEKDNRDKQNKQVETANVTNCPPQEENTDKECKEDTERQGKEEDTGIMNGVQMLQENANEDSESQEKNTDEEEETPACEEYDENETVKIEIDNEHMESVPTEKNTAGEKKDTERQDSTEKENESGEMSEMQERNDEDANSEEYYPCEGKKTEAWEDDDEHETGKGEVIEDVKNDAGKGDKEDTDGECVSVKDKEPGIMSDVQLVQGMNDKDAQSEEEGAAEEATEEECNHETRKEETDAEEVNSVSPEKENAEEEERQNSEKDVENEDLTEKVNLPSLAKLMSSTKVSVKNRTRREKIRKVMHLRKRVLPDYKNAVSGGVISSRWRWWRTSLTPVEEITPSKHIAKGQNLKKKVLTCRNKNAVMVNVNSRWGWWKTSPPT